MATLEEETGEEIGTVQQKGEDVGKKKSTQGQSLAQYFQCRVFCVSFVFFFESA